MTVNDTLLTALLTALITGAVNWGVFSTKLSYMTRDIAELKRRLDDIVDLQTYRRRTALKTDSDE